MKITDTHAHIYLPEFAENRREMLERAEKEGVKKILLPAIDSESHAALAELAATGVRFLVGGRLGETGTFREWSADLLESRFAGMFDVIPESEFRVDVSSTALRAMK